MPYGFVRMFIYFYFYFFLFFRRQSFRMIVFDRQAGPFQNFNRSQVMVIGRSVSFSDPRATPGWGRGAPQTPQNPPLLRFKTPGTSFWRKFFSVTKNYLMQWPIYLHELCACMHSCVCVWKPTLINSSLTGYLAFQVLNLDKLIPFYNNILSVMIACKQI